MPSIQFNFTVEMDGGDVYNVTADQRDLAKYEASDVYDARFRHTLARYVAWAASARQGLTKLSWAKFDKECVEAVDRDEEGAELDPTQTDRPDSN
jgi:hypothetical protein